jgi:hypothetical protein
MTDIDHSLNEESPRLREALELARPEMDGLAEADLLPINLDPLAAATTVRGALSGLLALRATIDEVFKVFDFSHLDKLEGYILAMIQAETVYRGTAVKPEHLAKLARDGFTLRCRLIADVRVLVKRGLLTAPRLAKLTGPNGYQATASDLLTLVAFMREHWTLFEHSSPVSLDEVDRAEFVGDQLVCAIGTRDKSTARWAAAADQRARAYTLLVRAYDELRFAVEYLRRHEGDAETIAPSLYKKRKTQCRKVDSNETTSVIEQNPPKDVRAESVGQFIDDPFVH